MAKENIQPGQLFKAFQGGHKGVAQHMMKRMKAALPNLKTQHSGSFHGKSNALGHGGRAAQLKARGVPGGVIGNMARAAGAAPGQTNFHGKKKRKVATPMKQELGMAFKKKRKGIRESTDGQPGAEGEKEMKRKGKKKQAPHLKETAHMKKRKAGFTAKEGDKEVHKRKSATCLKCKGGHPTAEHEKHAKKKSK